MTHAEIIDAFRTRIRELKQAHPTIAFADTPNAEHGNPGDKGNKFVAVIDTISSNPGVLLPWKELVEVCRQEGVWSVIDAAHSLGQEVSVFLPRQTICFNLYHIAEHKPQRDQTGFLGV